MSQRLGGVILAAEIPQLARLFLADDAREVARAEAAVKTADLGAGLAENRVVRGNRQVANHLQHMAAADGVARHQRDDHLRHRADEPLQIQHVEPRRPALVLVARRAAHALVAAGAKGVLAVRVRPRAGQQHDADGRVLARVGEGVNHLEHRFRAERVALVRPVDRHLRDAVALVVEDVLVIADGLPVHGKGGKYYRENARSAKVFSEKLSRLIKKVLE